MPSISLPDGATPASSKPPAAVKPPAKKTVAPKPAQPGTSQDYTAQTWAVALLQKLGMPVTATNEHAIVAWESAEGGHWNNTAWYNPVNTTQGEQGATSMNDVGVKAYTSWDQGLAATVATLENGRYQPILDALRQGSDAGAVAHAIVNSPWGTQQINLDANNSQYGTVQRTPTVSGTYTSSKTATPTQNPLQYLDNNPDIETQYGYLSAYLNDPELGPILKQAAAAGWGQNQLLAALEKTTWWKTTSQTAREMQALQRTDPAAYKEKFNGQLAQVQALATSMGINVSKDRLQKLATTALWSNWSPLQLQSAVGAEFKYNPAAAYPGTAGADVQKFKNLAGQYLVPLADQTLGTWTKQALQGKINPDDFSGYLSQQAKTLFPWMSKAIDSGVTPTQYLDPYRQAAAQTLELDPASVNLMDPKWMKLFQTVDPKTGDRTERGLASAMTMMRTDPTYGYDKTEGARNEAASFAANIAQAFGYSPSGSTLSGGVPQFNG